jgi:hypothetical protein
MGIKKYLGHSKKKYNISLYVKVSRYDIIRWIFRANKIVFQISNYLCILSDGGKTKQGNS